MRGAWHHRWASPPQYRWGRGHLPGNDGRHRPQVSPGGLAVAPADDEQADEESQAEECQPSGRGDAEFVSHIDSRVSRVTAALFHEHLVISKGSRSQDLGFG